MITTAAGPIRKGSVVLVNTRDGLTTTGTVDSVDEDIKNDRPGLDYIAADGTGRWAYADQVARVVTF